MNFHPIFNHKPIALLAWLFVSLLFLSGCAVEETGLEPPTKKGWGTHPALCGLAPYTWLPAEEVGGVVSFEEHKLSHLTAATLSAMLKQAGMKNPIGLVYDVRNFKLRYTTQDKGKKIEATAIVSLPVGTPPGESMPVLLSLHGTTGLNDQCAPSRKALEGVGLSAVTASFGYVTVSPDYLGMIGFGEGSPPGSLHPYLVGEPMAIASLDAVRAAARALKADDSLTQPDLDRMVLIGASQGGHGVLFTERFQPHYAPELGLVASAALVPPASLERSARLATEGLSGISDLLAAMWVAWRQWYEIDAPMSDVLSDEAPWEVATRLPELLTQTCRPDFREGMTKISQCYNATYLKAVAKGLPAEPWGCALKENSLTTTSLPRLKDRPILMTYSEDDVLVPPALERENFATLCAQGYRLQYRECAGVEHAQGAVAVFPWALAWLGDRLAGKALDPALICKTSSPVSCE